MSTGHLFAEFYPSEDRAMAILDTLRGYEKSHLFELHDAAVLVRDLDGEVRVRQTLGPTASKDAVKGATILGLTSLFFPAGVITSSIVGAGIGALTGRHKDSLVAASSMQEFGSLIELGQSAVVVLADSKWESAIRDVLTGVESRIIPSEVDTGTGE